LQLIILAFRFYFIFYPYIITSICTYKSPFQLVLLFFCQYLACINSALTSQSSVIVNNLLNYNTLKWFDSLLGVKKERNPSLVCGSKLNFYLQRFKQLYEYHEPLWRTLYACYSISKVRKVNTDSIYNIKPNWWMYIFTHLTGMSINSCNIWRLTQIWMDRCWINS
jgi:hypothetical protein